MPGIPPFPVTQVVDLRDPAVRAWFDLVRDNDNDVIKDGDFDTVGYMVRIGNDTFRSRTITGGDGIGITNGNAVAGNTVIAYDIDSMSENTDVDEVNDFVVIYDSSTGNHVKAQAGALASQEAIQRSWMGL